MNKFQLYFFSVLFIAVLGLVGYIMLPFLNVIAISLILAMLVRPFFKFLVQKKVNKSIASALVVLSVILLLVAPLTLILSQLVQQSVNVSASGFEYAERLAEHANTLFSKVAPEIELNMQSVLKQSVFWIGERLGVVFSSTAHTVIQLVLIIIALFFFVRDGDKFRDIMINLSPLSDDADRDIIRQLRQTVHAVVVGSVSVGLIQGFLVGVGLFIFGVPNAVLWGTIASVTAFIPGIGTALVLVPAVIYLYFQAASIGYAIGLLLWGALLVGLVDNIMIPYFYGRGQHIHPLLILFSVLGGLIVFGPVGFLYGPLVISLFFALLAIYKKLPGVGDEPSRYSSEVV